MGEASPIGFVLGTKPASSLEFYVLINFSSPHGPPAVKRSTTRTWTSRHERSRRGSNGCCVQ